MPASWGDSLGPIRILRARNNKDVDRFGDLLELAQEIELRCAKRPCFSFLLSAGRENDGLEAKLGGELDGEMAESSDTQYSNPVAWLG